ncbi:hypothetical protein Y032_0048g1710 [Ancylostoma ceylanicum]|uniref:Uncharacterized protein n=1 Tax=Ancylostoma ceylanicum TaxID=53326 RepID=A0A016UAT4_9BILA|nr:hypothetical protein Y032_0048g1710 [Ancylostoma ceylanicum]
MKLSETYEKPGKYRCCFPCILSRSLTLVSPATQKSRACSCERICVSWRGVAESVQDTSLRITIRVSSEVIYDSCVSSTAVTR